MERLYYVSECYIAKLLAPSTAFQIVTDSHPRNAKLGISGALLFTGTYFAQIIEGSRQSVEDLMLSIGRDPRHGNVKVIQRSPISRRIFQEMKLAYSGPSQFVERRVMRSFHETAASDRKRSAEWVTELAFQFLATHTASIQPNFIGPAR